MTQDNKKIIICVSSTGESLDSEIDPRFGRCKNFLIVEVKDNLILNVKTIKNQGVEQNQGAGISAAEQIGKLDVDMLITGDVGPKAVQVLEQMNIKICYKSGKITRALSECLKEDNIELKNNKLSDESIKVEKKELLDDHRIFIPLMDNKGEESEISLHFGHAPYFGLYNTKTKELTIQKNELNHSDPSKSPVDQVFEQVNPTIVYARDMGSRAISLFMEKNIILKTGSFKTVKEVIENINSLNDLTKGCSH
jgi:predicted Fe-Mo cluster-binding NifX family protein